MIAALGSRLRNLNCFLCHRQSCRRHWKVRQAMCGSPMQGSMNFHSSNTWIGARKNNRYVKTSTGQFTNNTIVSGRVCLHALFCVENFNQQHVNYGTGDSNNTDSQNTTAFDGKFCWVLQSDLLIDSRKHRRGGLRKSYYW